MAENLDWEEVLKEFDKNMLKAELLSEQIREERKNPENYNLKEMADRVNKYLEEKKTFDKVNDIKQGGEENE